MITNVNRIVVTALVSVIPLAGCNGSSDTADPADVTDPAEAPATADRPAGVVEFTSLIDDTGSVTVDVPAAWVDVRTAPDGEHRQIVASVDVNAFEAGYDLPGLRLRSGASPDARAVAGAAQADTIAAVEDSGCELERSLPYDDGVYTGDESILRCGESDTTVHVIGGATDTATVWFGLVLVIEPGDETTRELVGDSFFVD